MAINWYPGHMAKTKREIKEILSLIDIVFEVIDARIPKSSKNWDIEELIKDKPRILVVTKYDLCDKLATDKWLKYYTDKGYHVVPIDLLHESDLSKIKEAYKEIKEILDKKRITKGLNIRKLRALVLGIPNVGKSTLINRLVGKKATQVGNKPGVTKNLEWIRINNDLELLDTPGILWPKLDNEIDALNLASMMAIKEEILNNEELAIHIIKTMLKIYPNNIKTRYNLTDTSDIVSVLDQIGAHIGAVRNNETDYERVYTTILNDLHNGYLGKITFD